MWEEVVENVDDVEAKANLQPPFYIKEIDFKYPKSHCPLVKKDKKDTYWKLRNEAFNKDKDKAKSHNSSASSNQT